MVNELAKLNAKLVQIFNDVRSIEERHLAQSMFADLSLRDMHTIEAIAVHHDQTVSQVAQRMYLSPGSMTKVIDKLVEHQYVLRQPNSVDRRIINLDLTAKGHDLFEAHSSFHQEMCRALTMDLNDSEFKKMIQALDNLIAFLSRQ